MERFASCERKRTHREELLDAGNQIRVTAGKIFGIKKNVFGTAGQPITPQDFATVTISSWEA